MRTFNIEKYNEYKSYFSNDEWKTEIESLLQESSRFEFEILYEEKMYDDYRCFAKDLKFLAKNLTAFEKASELREKRLVEYKRKSALCEELRWAF